MVQRWLADKLNKQKKQRRAYLKHYPTKIRYDKTLAYEIFQNRARVRSTDGPRNGAHLPVLNNTFQQDIPATKEGSIHETEPQGVKRSESPRWSSQFRMHMIMQNDRMQGIDEFIRGPCLKDVPGIKIYLWFSGSNYLFIKEYDDVGPVHWSKVYKDREQAYKDFLNNRVLWLDIGVEH